MPQPLAVATPPILASVSPVLTQIVTTAIGEEPAGFVLTVSPTQETLGVGQTAVLTVTIRGVSGFNQPVQLGCTGLPVEATCTFIQPLIPDGGGTTSLYLATSAPRDCGSNTPYFVGSLAETPGRTLAFAMPGLVLMLAGVRRRWRKRAKLLGGTILLLSLAAMAAISGCGHCTDLGTRPGNYSFTVTATPQGGPIIQAQSQTITLTVTIP